ncbi:MAG: hypothetical protein JWL88_404 [Parcubacteria group bacterium]|nr:hypothetical protein [Parcubacteria group bacterium]
MKLSVVIPCYNEASTIDAVFTQVRDSVLPDGWEKEIIIVDDGSDAETREALTRLEHPALQVHTRPDNAGKGAAVKFGLARASGDYCIVQDADLEYDPNEYRKLLAPIIDGNAVSVFGSRVLGVNNVPFSHIYFYGGLLVAQVFNAAFGTRFTDITTCYKVFPRALIPLLTKQPSNDFVFDAVELTYAIMRHGKVIEIPVSYVARTRTEGKKLNWKHGVRAAFAIVALRLGLPLEPMLRILRFIVSGVSALLMNLLVLYALVQFLHVWYLAASVISFCAGFLVSFLMNKLWTFGNRAVERSHIQFMAHLIVAIVNLGLNIALLYFFVEVLGAWYILGQILATAITATGSYVLFHRIYRPT